MDELHHIAQAAAQQEAEQYYEQEHLRQKMLAFPYVVRCIVGAIGQAHFDAGYVYESLSVEQRETYARDALRAVGYPEGVV